jgi:hypothetical protein
VSDATYFAREWSLWGVMRFCGGYKRGNRAEASSPKNTNILDGNAPDLYKECQDYEDKIRAVGGIDLFLGGIGAGEW